MNPIDNFHMNPIDNFGKLRQKLYFYTLSY